MGCSVACVASLTNSSYKQAQKLFEKNHSATRGYYLDEVVRALAKKGFNYKSGKLTAKTKKYLAKNGSIIFIKRSKKFPAGHYLLRTSKGWMNSWQNYPKISPARAGFDRQLPGEVQYIIFQE